MSRPPRRSVPLLLALGLLPLLCSGCLISRDTVNEALDAETAAKLVIGETTANEVAELIGAPNEVVQLGRRSAWRYEFIQSKRSVLFLVVVSFMNTDTREDRIWVFFDEQDVLSHYGTTFQAKSSRYAMPWNSQKPTEPAPPEDEGATPEEVEAGEGQAAEDQVGE